MRRAAALMANVAGGWVRTCTLSSLDIARPKLRPFFLLAALLVGVVVSAVAHAESAAKPTVAGSALNIAQRIERADFRNRIWKAASEPHSPLASTQVLPHSSDIDQHLESCENVIPCRQNVFVAGTGYLKGWSGAKNSVKVVTPQGPLHLALLTAVVQADMLTKAKLSLFEPGHAMPRCHVPITAIPGQHVYGTWRIHGVYRMPGDAHMAWLVAEGGDAGFGWSTSVFLQFGPRCEVLGHRLVHIEIDEVPGVYDCKDVRPKMTSIVALNPDGSVRIKKPRRSCLDVSVSEIDSGIRVGE